MGQKSLVSLLQDSLNNLQGNNYLYRYLILQNAAKSSEPCKFLSSVLMTSPGNINGLAPEPSLAQGWPSLGHGISFFWSSLVQRWSGMEF